LNERELAVLEQYDLEVKNVYKGRGAFILETESGWKSLREFTGSKKKLQFQNYIQKKLKEEGLLSDLAVENREGELLSADKYETAYIVREWFDARECNARDEKEVYRAAEHLARLHRKCRQYSFPEDIVPEQYQNDVTDTFSRHNRELKKTRAHMRSRRQKSDFEICFLNHYEEYFEKGQKAEEMISSSGYRGLLETAIGERRVCHGGYNHHNVVFGKMGTGLLDFEHCSIGVQVSDLYDFIRKIMEKWDWDIRIGAGMLERYNRICGISAGEWEYLKVCIRYPEKFWKIANHYYNSRKSWIPDKNMEKLKRVISQEEKKEEFLRRIDA